MAENHGNEPPGDRPRRNAIMMELPGTRQPVQPTVILGGDDPKPPPKADSRAAKADQFRKNAGAPLKPAPKAATRSPRQGRQGPPEEPQGLRQEALAQAQRQEEAVVLVR